MKLPVVVVASIVAATAVLGSCADVDRVSAPLTEPSADLSLSPGWDWDGIGIATGGTKPCDPPIYPTGDGPLVQEGDVGVANNPCTEPPPSDPPSTCYYYTAYAPPLFWGPYTWVGDSWRRAQYTIKASPYRDDTMVFGMVKYYSATGWRESPFSGSITFVTGSGLSNIHVKFYGDPFGSGLTVQVCDDVVPGDYT